MAALLNLVLGIFTGSAGAKVGHAVAGVTQLGLIAAIATGAYTWLNAHGDEIFIALTYKDLVFWGAILFVIVRLVQRAPAPPAWSDRG